MDRFENNRDPGIQQDQYRRLYDEIYEKIYNRAFNDGYKHGKTDGYNIGYDHALKDHYHNEYAIAENNLSDTRWHGKSSKSWSWI
jgi:hypothetical protein